VLRFQKLEDRRLLTSIGDVPILTILAEIGPGREHDFHPAHNVGYYRDLLDGSGPGTPLNYVSEINFSDLPGGSKGRFGNDRAFPRGNGDNFAVSADTTLDVNDPGLFTFGINSDEGSRLIIDGQVVIDDDALHTAQDRFGQINLSAGRHALELVYFENRAGATVELFAASGPHTSFNSNFHLLGVTRVNGIRAGEFGFEVSQRFSTGTVTGLDDADELLKAPIQNIVDYFTENSLGKLRLTPAKAGDLDGTADGIVGPYQFAVDTFDVHQKRRTAIVRADADFNFSLYDKNNNGVIEDSELIVNVITGQRDGNEHSGTLRPQSDFQPDSFRRITRIDPVTGREYDVIQGRLVGQTTLTDQEYRYFAHSGANRDFWSATDARAHFRRITGDPQAEIEAASGGANVRAINVQVTTNDASQGGKAVRIPDNFPASAVEQWQSINAHLHEISHLLHDDAGDFYHLEEDEWRGLYRYDIMSFNGDFITHHNPWTKMRLGWIQPRVITEPGWYRLEAVESSGQVLRINGPANEYLLIENRWRGTSYDAGSILDHGPYAVQTATGIPGDGLASWHIDEGRLDEFRNGDYTDPPFIQKLNADGTPESNRGDLWTDVKDFDALTAPANVWHDGSRRDIVIHSIDPPGPTMWFYVDFTAVPRDHLEPNDNVEFARDLGTWDQNIFGLTIHRANEDWFRWTAPASGILTVDIQFAHADGNIDLYLYDERVINGPDQGFLDQSLSVTDNERVVAQVSAGRRYYIRARGVANAVNPDYRLLINGPELPTGLAGDYNRDGEVDNTDYVEWRAHFGQQIAAPGDGPDGNFNGIVDAADYILWRKNVGSRSATLKVDFGNSADIGGGPGGTQPAFVAFEHAGNLTVTKSFASPLGRDETVEVTIGAINGTIHWRDYAAATGQFSNLSALLSDGALLNDAGTIQLQIADLLDGAYQITTYHHTTQFGHSVRPGPTPFDIILPDSPFGEVISNDVIMSENDSPFLTKRVFQFTVSGGASRDIQFRRSESVFRDDHMAINGFDLIRLASGTTTTESVAARGFESSAYETNEVHARLPNRTDERDGQMLNWKVAAQSIGNTSSRPVTVGGSIALSHRLGRDPDFRAIDSLLETSRFHLDSVQGLPIKSQAFLHALDRPIIRPKLQRTNEPAMQEQGYHEPRTNCRVLDDLFAEYCLSDHRFTLGNSAQASLT
jgi:hypothetical protein